MCVYIFIFYILEKKKKKKKKIGFPSRPNDTFFRFFNFTNFF